MSIGFIPYMNPFLSSNYNFHIMVVSKGLTLLNRLINNMIIDWIDLMIENH